MERSSAVTHFGMPVSFTTRAIYRLIMMSLMMSRMGCCLRPKARSPER